MKNKLCPLLWAIFLAFALTYLLLPMRPWHIASISVANSTYDMKIGDQIQLDAEAKGTRASIEYQSDQPLVAQVSHTGRIHAISPGEATITLSADRAQATVRVLVSGTPVRNLTLNAASITMERGQISGLSASMNADATDKRVYWASGDPDIATVDETGRITAVGPGSTVIVCSTPNGFHAEATVSVIVSAASVELEPNRIQLHVGGTASVQAMFFPEDATDAVAEWKSSDEGVFTVTEDGVVLAIAPGDATLRVQTQQGLYAAAQVTVE